MNIARQLFKIAQNKLAPEDIDYSVSAAIIVYSVFTLLFFVIFGVNKEFSQPLLYSIVLTASAVLALVVLLKIQRKENRIIQTITAVFGIGSIVMCLVIFLALTGIFAILIIPVWVYGFIVCIRIIKSSFSCPTYLAVVIIISSYLFSTTMLSIVCPQSTQEALVMMENLQAQVEEAKIEQEKASAQK